MAQLVKNWSILDLRKDNAVSEVSKSLDVEVKLTVRQIVPELHPTLVKCNLGPGRLLTTINNAKFPAPYKR